MVHLLAGGYVQSKRDQCLFYKGVNSSQFLYLLFRVDDFQALCTTQGLIDEFHAHMEKKYEVTTNVDGLFLGVRITKQDGCYLFSKPHQLRSLFDKWSSNGMEGRRYAEELSCRHRERVSTL